MNVVAIIQARMGSTRLPGKVFLPIEGKTMLERVVERTKLAKKVDEVVVATTTLIEDDTIESLCEEKGWNCFRGSPVDVLDRYYKAAVFYRADPIVRITSDCPLIDPEIIDTVLSEFLSIYSLYDYVSTVSRRTYPKGLDVEVVSVKALEKCWLETGDKEDREHVTRYILREVLVRGIGITKFLCRNVACPEGNYRYLNWSVDTQEDLDRVREIYRYFGDNLVPWRDVREYVCGKS